MTAPVRAPGSAATGLLGMLMATVRGEFRSDVLEFGADDPVFGTGCCRVAGCERHSRGQGLCQGHRLRWVHAGRPDLDVFAATTDSRWHRQQPNQRCRVGRLRLRGCPPGTLRTARPALAARRSARTRRLAARPSGGDSARTGRIVPDRALHIVAAGGGPILRIACEHLESERATRHRRIRPAVHRHPGAHRRTHPVRPAGNSAEAGDAVRAATPP